MHICMTRNERLIQYPGVMSKYQVFCCSTSTQPFCLPLDLATCPVYQRRALIALLNSVVQPHSITCQPASRSLTILAIHAQSHPATCPAYPEVINSALCEHLSTDVAQSRPVTYPVCPSVNKVVLSSIKPLHLLTMYLLCLKLLSVL